MFGAGSAPHATSADTSAAHRGGGSGSAPPGTGPIQHSHIHMKTIKSSQQHSVTPSMEIRNDKSPSNPTMASSSSSQKSKQINHGSSANNSSSNREHNTVHHDAPCPTILEIFELQFLSCAVNGVFLSLLQMSMYVFSFVGFVLQVLSGSCGLTIFVRSFLLCFCTLYSQFMDGRWKPQRKYASRPQPARSRRTLPAISAWGFLLNGTLQFGAATGPLAPMLSETGSDTGMWAPSREVAKGRLPERQHYWNQQLHKFAVNNLNCPKARNRCALPAQPVRRPVPAVEWANRSSDYAKLMEPASEVRFVEVRFGALVGSRPSAGCVPRRSRCPETVSGLALFELQWLVTKCIDPERKADRRTSCGIDLCAPTMYPCRATEEGRWQDAASLMIIMYSANPNLIDAPGSRDTGGMHSPRQRRV